METKSCNLCNIDLPITSFNKSLSNKGGLKTRCKSCQRIENKKYDESKLGLLEYYIVYYIPNEHYVGITNQPKARMKHHEKNGKNIDGWRVLFCSSDRHQARLIENRFHDMGFEGLNINC